MAGAMSAMSDRRSDIGVRAQAFAQDFAQATGGTGEQQAVEGSAGGEWWSWESLDTIVIELL